MESLLTQAAADWTNHRQRFIMEMLAMLSVVTFVVVFTWTAGTPTVRTNIFLLSVDIFGGTCGIGSGLSRKSVNILLLNAILVVFSVAGLLKIYFG